MIIELLKKLKEALLSALPVFAVVLFIYITGLITHENYLNGPEFLMFSLSAIMITLGMWLFNVGSEKSMSKIGEYLGSSITKKQNMILLVIVFFLVGVFVTVAEPDLAVLAEQVPINKWVLIISIGVGVGIFLVVGALRILFAKSLKIWLLAFYGFLFALATLVDQTFIPLSLDSGGVTTGPITVPFILALGIGIAASRSGNKNADSFGLVAFSSLGPILVVMIISLTIRDAPYTFEAETITKFSEIGPRFLHSFFKSENNTGAFLNVLLALSPILLFFIIINFTLLKLPAKKFWDIILGVGITYIGLVLFLGSVETGFLPMGQRLGIEFAGDSSKYWMLVLIGVILGIAAVFAEPAVHVLTDQIENVSSGTVHKKAVLAALAIGNGLAIGLSILRIITPNFNLLYIIVPGYVVAFVLSFFVPDIYFAIAFDSGGVVSGPMNSTFILPYAIGACYSFNGNSEHIMTDAFGTIAVVAMMPLLSIQFIGLFATIRHANQLKIARHRIKEEFDEQIIHF